VYLGVQAVEPNEKGLLVTLTEAQPPIPTKQYLVQRNTGQDHDKIVFLFSGGCQSPPNS
jgi:hypothetical protein